MYNRNRRRPKTDNEEFLYKSVSGSTDKRHNIHTHINFIIRFSTSITLV